MAKNWAVKTCFINWSRYMNAMKLGGDFPAAIIVTVPFTAIIWPSVEPLFSNALIKRAACKIVMYSRSGDLVGAIMRRDCTLTTFYEWTYKDGGAFFLVKFLNCSALLRLEESHSHDFIKHCTVPDIRQFHVLFHIILFVSDAIDV